MNSFAPTPAAAIVTRERARRVRQQIRVVLYPAYGREVLFDDLAEGNEDAV